MIDTAGLYETLERVANLIRSEERRVGSDASLQPVHLQALWFLSRANRYSDTLSSVAQYLGVTEGTTSKTLRVLRERGLTRPERDGDDGRVSHLRLTDAGRKLIAEELPPASVTAALAEIEPEEAAALDGALRTMLREIQARRGGRAFGVCRTCRHFGREPAGFRCGLTGEALRAEETVQLCGEHAAPSGSEGGTSLTG
ncbi:MAG: MarR family winged helix-turn-helix transcriptional regulator [Miltoncostaeaceae bacterium]